MNFLSHYFFYQKQDPYFNTGLILPDLVKNYCQTHIQISGHFNRPAFINLAEGCQTHLNCDKKFHNSEFFKSTTNYLSETFDAQCAWPRKWFLNHLLMEILLDRVLMDMHSNLCQSFYNNLQQVDIDELLVFIRKLGVVNGQNFKIGFEKFVEHQFLFEYQYNEKISFALNKVYQKVGIPYEFTKDDQRMIENQMPKLLEFIRYKLDDLVQELDL